MRRLAGDSIIGGASFGLVPLVHQRAQVRAAGGRSRRRRSAHGRFCGRRSGLGLLGARRSGLVRGRSLLGRLELAELAQLAFFFRLLGLGSRRGSRGRRRLRGSGRRSTGDGRPGSGVLLEHGVVDGALCGLALALLLRSGVLLLGQVAHGRPEQLGRRGVEIEAHLRHDGTSDEIINAPGWSANITCFYPAPVADFTATNLAPAVGEVLTLQDLSTNSPTSWLWDISPAIVNFLNSTDPNSQHPQLQFTATGSYTITLTATNSGGSNSITKTGYIVVSEASSCIPGYVDGTGEGDYISLVQLEGIVNNTGPSPYPFYTDYSNLTANLTKGSSYTITLSAGYYPDGNNISVWIDYNQDNTFDPSEKLGNVSLLATPETGTISFVVPFNAATGTTRMRVREVYGNSDFDPCSEYYYGETEDYRVYIPEVVYCAPDYGIGTEEGDYISLVQLQEINNFSGPAPAPFYTYYDAQTAFLNTGSAYTLTLSAGTYPSSNNIAAWIDYDFDGTFEDDEKLGFVSLLSQPEQGTITFTVPAIALTGTTRMRVREAFASLEFGPCNFEYYGETEDYPVNISNAGKSLQLTVFLEGLYTGAGMMSQANNELGPEFAPGIADQVSVEFHNSLDYSIIEHSIANVNLGTNGQLILPLPVSLTGSYYVTLRHRNSIETTSSLPITFSPGMTSLQFNDPVQVYGGNVLQKYPGEYVLYGGDVNQDGIVDSTDMIAVDNDASGFTSGYLATDANGDGLVDSTDMILVDNNSGNFVTVVTP